MRRITLLIIVFVYIAVLTLSCSKIKNDDASLDFLFDKSGNYTGFSDLPSDYKIEAAKNDGYFVTQNSEVIANKNVWDNFVDASLHRENTGIRMVNFYTEYTDSPYFLDLFYDDGYYYLFDSSAENQQKQPYSYLLTLDGQFGNPLKASSVIVLTNDNTLTFNKVMSVMISSNMDYIKSVSPFKIVMFK